MTISELRHTIMDLDHASRLVRDVFLSSDYTVEEALNEAFNKGLITQKSYRILHSLISA